MDDQGKTAIAAFIFQLIEPNGFNGREVVMSFVTVGKENSRDIEIYYKDWRRRSAGAIQPRLAAQRGRLKVYPGLPHGMCTTQQDQVNENLLGFIKD
jgi:hypothetical protein